MYLSEKHPSKACLPIAVTDAGIVKNLSEEKPQNDEEPSDVTVSGIVI